MKEEIDLPKAGLRLRPLARDDLPIVAREIGRIEVARMLAKVPRPYTMADAERYFDNKAHPEARRYVIDDGDFCGVIGLGTSPRPDLLGLGYWLRMDRWGRGYMSAAARAVVDIAFAQGAREVTADAFFDNPGSQIVLRRIGMQETGTRFLDSTWRPEPAPGTTFRLSRGRWLWLRGEETRIETERLILDPIAYADLAAHRALIDDPAVAGMVGSAALPYTEAAAEARVGGSLWRGDGGRLAVRLKDGALIGDVNAHRLGGRYDIGYEFGRVWHGQGYGTEAVQALMDWLCVHSVPEGFIAEAFDDNPASGRLLEKLGFERQRTAMRLAKSRETDSPAGVYELKVDG